jgi:hypothetical protein
MLRLGFHQLWVEMVMRLVTTISFSVLFNGDHLDGFSPSRGIRQGDPISPYLFLLAAEGLSCLLKSRVESLSLNGIKVAPSALMVCHLLFADDSLLFFKATRDSAQEINDILQIYCSVSGQQVNLDKSSIHFAKGCQESSRQEIMDCLDIHNVTLSERYLGMPSDVGTSVSGAFKYLKDRVWKRVQGWLELLLSMAGKEVLIKAVAQAIPTYSMACFRLPRGLCQHINSLLRNFWWGSKKRKRRTCWVAWDDMTMPKHMGGLGFRDIELFNLALLAKQAWRLIQEPSSLSARILKAVYFPNKDFLEAELGASPSKIWRSILDGCQVLKLGMIKRIGTGEDTHIWSSNWILRDGLLWPVTCVMDANIQEPPRLVSDLIDQITMSWNRSLLHEAFLPMDYEIIENIPLSTRRQTDFWAWHYDRKGVFSVRSAYKLLVQTRENRTAWLNGTTSSSNIKEEEKSWTELWKVKVPSKLNFFCGD